MRTGGWTLVSFRLGVGSELQGGDDGRKEEEGREEGGAYLKSATVSAREPTSRSG